MQSSKMLNLCLTHYLIHFEVKMLFLFYCNLHIVLSHQITSIACFHSRIHFILLLLDGKTNHVSVDVSSMRQKGNSRPHLPLYLESHNTFSSVLPLRRKKGLQCHAAEKSQLIPTSICFALLNLIQLLKPP